MVKIKTGWLITWEWGNDAKAVVDKVITIINHRRGGDSISNLIEIIYDINTSNIAELGSYAKDKAYRPYKSKSHFNGTITCGSNPFIMARKVKNIEISVNNDQKEVIKWVQPATYRFEEAHDKFVEITGVISKEYTRIRSGLLCFECLWDRNKNRLKTSKEI